MNFTLINFLKRGYENLSIYFLFKLVKSYSSNQYSVLLVLRVTVQLEVLLTCFMPLTPCLCVTSVLFLVTLQAATSLNCARNLLIHVVNSPI